MAVPKKKISPSRRDMRRHAGASNKLRKLTVTLCPSCNEPKRPHAVCVNGTDCGAYKAKQVGASAQ